LNQVYVFVSFLSVTAQGKDWAMGTTFVQCMIALLLSVQYSTYFFILHN